jgi:hypothetical protein
MMVDVKDQPSQDIVTDVGAEQFLSVGIKAPRKRGASWPVRARS